MFVCLAGVTKHRLCVKLVRQAQCAAMQVSFFHESMDVKLISLYCGGDDGRQASPRGRALRPPLFPSSVPPSPCCTPFSPKGLAPSRARGLQGGPPRIASLRRPSLRGRSHPWQDLERQCVHVRANPVGTSNPFHVAVGNGVCLCVLLPRDPSQFKQKFALFELN